MREQDDTARQKGTERLQESKIFGIVVLTALTAV